VYALDTNSLIYFFKGQGQVGAILRNKQPQEVAIPSVVVYEVEVGISRLAQPDKRRRAFEDLLRAVRILPFDEAAARASAQIRRALESAGTPIGPLDTLIAGSAFASSAILVTHNTREFGRVRGLRIEDWL
jgi:tRNA(fMet)-specific endonuclease VapC